jgi:flagellum-specific ATP synthase
MTTAHLLADLVRVPAYRLYGRVTAVQGMLVEIGGVEHLLSIGGRCTVVARDGRRVACEVVGFRQDRALLMPFSTLDGVGLGCRAEIAGSDPVVRPHPAWLGRVVNALGEPLDGKGALPSGAEPFLLRASPPPAHSRQRVKGKVDLGVRAINTFLTCCRGQRMGIFSGSGVGKSSLLSMMARYTAADVTVIGLIGERGREVQEFLADDLGPEGLARSVVVVATSDESPLMRRQAAYLTLTVAEYFRDRDSDVLCLMDSVTRFAMAQREIGLSAGEPPASKGYTPSVFAELPRLLERAGPGLTAAPGKPQGHITGLFTVLVDGDDHNEPVADAVRAILDGHITLSRAIAERGRFPAIDVLKSISRLTQLLYTPQEKATAAKARRLLALYANMEELVRIGAYAKGADPEVDEAVRLWPRIEEFLQQETDARFAPADAFAMLEAVLQPAVQPIQAPAQPRPPGQPLRTAGR